MNYFPEEYKAPSKDQISLLEDDIARLEMQMLQIEGTLNAFENQIRGVLKVQILRIRDLTELYKNQKRVKKAKRLEQKRKGKNYRQAEGLKVVNKPFPLQLTKDINAQKELKRLYKEAIVLVHPDKFVNELRGIGERANQLTVQLNQLYDSGNLDELSQFHEHIISGNAMAYQPQMREIVVDTKALLNYLRNRKEDLATALEQTKQSPTYEVLSTYQDPLIFIEELRLQFDHRIRQLEKRTRRARQA